MADYLKDEDEDKEEKSESSSPDGESEVKASSGGWNENERGEKKDGDDDGGDDSSEQSEPEKEESSPSSDQQNVQPASSSVTQVKSADEVLADNGPKQYSVFTTDANGKTVNESITARNSELTAGAPHLDRGNGRSTYMAGTNQYNYFIRDGVVYDTKMNEKGEWEVIGSSKDWSKGLGNDLPDTPFAKAAAEKEKEDAINSITGGVNPRSMDNWYAGDKPTGLDYLAHSYGVLNKGEARNNAVDRIYEDLHTPGTSIYNPYSNATCGGYQELANYGLSVPRAGWSHEDIEKKYAEVEEYLIRSSKGNVIQPTKKNCKAAGIDYQTAMKAYQVHLIHDTEEQTQKAEAELERYKATVEYYVKQGNYSLEDIFNNKIDLEKDFPTLYKMEDKMHDGDIMQFSRSIDFSKEWQYGYAWAALNDGGTGSAIMDAAYARLGDYTQYQPDQDRVMRHTWGSETFNPYADTGTIDDVFTFYGTDKLDEAFFEKHAADGGAASKTQRKMWATANKARDNSVAIDAEYAQMTADIDELVSLGCYNKDEIIDEIFNKNKSKYSTLLKLDKVYSADSLIETAWGTDYSRKNVEAAIEQKLADRANGKTNGSKSVNDTADVVSGKKTKRGGILSGIFNGGSDVDSVSSASALISTPPVVKPNVPDAAADENTEEKSALDTSGLDKYASATVSDIPVPKGAKRFNAFGEPIGPEMPGQQEEEYTASELAALEPTIQNDSTIPSLNELPTDGKYTFDFSNYNYVPQAGKAEREMKAEADEKAAQFSGIIHRLGTDQEKRAWQLASITAKDDTSRLFTSILSGQMTPEQAAASAFENADTYAGANYYQAYDQMMAYRRLEGEVTALQNELASGAPKTVIRQNGEIMDMIADADKKKDDLTLTEEERNRYRSSSVELKAILDRNFLEGKIEAEVPEDYNAAANYAAKQEQLEAKQRQLAEMKSDYDYSQNVINEVEERYRTVDRLNALTGAKREDQVRATDIFQAAQSYAGDTQVDWNGIDIYHIAEKYGYIQETINNAADQNARTAQKHITNIDVILRYAEDSRVIIPDNVVENLRNNRAALERSIADTVYYKVPQIDGFEEKAEQARQSIIERFEKNYDPETGIYMGGTESEIFIPLAMARPGDGTNANLFVASKENGYDTERNYFTDAERNTYLAIYAMDGPEAAQKYYDHMTNPVFGRINSRITEETIKAEQAFAEEHPLISTFETIVMSPFANAAGIMQAAIDHTINRGMVNPNAGGYLGHMAISAARETAKNKLVNGAGGQNTFMGAATGVMYDLITSASDSSANALVVSGLGLTSLFSEASTLGNIASKALGASLMGGGGASATYADYRRQGYSDDVAVPMALVTYLGETLTEAIELDDILKAFKAGNEAVESLGKNFIDYLKKQAPELVNEAFGEGMSEFLEGIGGDFILGADSERNRRIEELKQSGMSPVQAEQQAYKEFCERIMIAGAMGAASAGLSTTAAYTAGAITGRNRETRQAEAWNKSVEQMQQDYADMLAQAEQNRIAQENANLQAALDPNRNAVDTTGVRPDINENLQGTMEVVRQVPMAEQARQRLGVFLNKEGTNEAKSGAVLEAVDQMPAEQSEQIMSLAQNASQQEKDAISNAVLMGGKAMDALMALGPNPSAASKRDFLKLINKEYKNKENRAKANAAVDSYLEAQTDPNAQTAGPDVYRDRFPGMSQEEYNQEIGGVYKRITVIDSAEVTGNNAESVKGIAAALTGSDGNVSESIAAAGKLVDALGVKSAARSMRSMLLTAAENGVTGEEVIGAVRSAVLAGKDALQFLRDGGAGDSIENLLGFMNMAYAETQRPDTQQAIKQELHEAAVAEEVRNQVANGEMDSVTPYLEAEKVAEQRAEEAAQQLEEATGRTGAAHEAADAATQAFLENPTDQQAEAAHKAALGKLEGAETVQTQMEQHNKTAQDNLKAAQDSARDATGKQLKAVRQAAITVVDANDKAALAAATAREEAQASRDNAKSGDTGKAYLNNGRNAVGFHYAVIGENGLVTSNNLDGSVNTAFPQNLQNRNRGSEKSNASVDTRARVLNPEMLGESAEVSGGAPLVTKDGVVLAGNGRTMSIRLAQQNGLDTAKGYNNWLRQNAERFGINPADIQDNSVLVRVLDDAGDLSLEQIVEYSNQSSLEDFSENELAVNDSEKLTNDMLALYDGSGNIESKGNSGFINAFINSIVPENQRGSFFNEKNGQVIGFAQKAFKRVRNALVQLAYGSEQLTNAVTTESNPDAKTVVNSLVEYAGKMAEYNNDVKNGRVNDFGIAETVAKAYEVFRMLRANGTSVQDYLGQLTMPGFGNGSDDLSPEVKSTLLMFDSSLRSGKRIKENLENLINNAYGYGDPSQKYMDGLGPKELPSRERFFDDAYNGDVAGQQSMFSVAGINIDEQMAQFVRNHPEYTSEGLIGVRDALIERAKAFADRMKTEAFEQSNALARAQKQREFNRNAAFAEKICNRFGVKYRFDDSLKSFEEGYYDDDGTVVLNSNATQEQTFKRVLFHELTHRTETKEQYKQLQDILLTNAYGATWELAKAHHDAGTMTKEESDLYNAAVDKQNFYAETGHPLKGGIDEAARELTANLTYEKLFKGDEKYIRDLVAKEPSLAQKILDFISDIINAFTGDTVQTDDLQKARDLFKQALSEQNSSLSRDSTKYSLAGINEDGVKVFISNMRPNMTRESLQKNMINVWQNVFANNPIPVHTVNENGDTREFVAHFDPTYNPNNKNESTAIGEQLRSTSKNYGDGSKSGRRAVLELIDDIPEMISSMDYLDGAENDGHRNDTLHNNAVYFHYLRTPFIYKGADGSENKFNLNLTLMEHEDGSDWTYYFYASNYKEGKKNQGNTASDFSSGSPSVVQSATLGENSSMIAKASGDEASLLPSDPIIMMPGEAVNNSEEKIEYKNVVDAGEAYKPVVSEEGTNLTTDVGADSGSTSKYSLASWTPEEQATVRQNLLNRTDSDGNQVYSEDQVNKWINDINSVAAIIAANPDTLDYKAAPDKTAMKPNNEYVVSIDLSTLCAKRRLYQGTFDMIQKLMPNTMLTSDDLINIREMMAQAGDETPCGICYVESRRRNLGKFTGDFLRKYEGDSEGFKPNYADLTTTDGLRKLQTEHPETYDAFIREMNRKGSNNPKVVQLRTDYRGDIRNLTPAQIKKIVDIGGLRIQSFSDFETPHLIDMMQALADATAMALPAQAYSKVPNFAEVFGGSGIKINLSLISDGTGFDENGNLTFSNYEGMDINEALRIRDMYPDNVGTILVGLSDQHILAAMADDRIDFIIPFHKSGWGKKQLEQLSSMRGYHDYTADQNERRKTGEKTKTGKDKVKKAESNFTPNGPDGYWDYSLTGKENAEKYLQMCKEDGRIPKFARFLDSDGEGGYKLKEDGSTDGYWKLLIDFKMYNHQTGEGAPQMPVTMNVNMEAANRVLNEYDGNPDVLPVDANVARQFVEKYKNDHPGRRKFSLSPEALRTELDSMIQDSYRRQEQQIRADASAIHEQAAAAAENQIRMYENRKTLADRIGNPATIADRLATALYDDTRPLLKLTYADMEAQKELVRYLRDKQARGEKLTDAEVNTIRMGAQGFAHTQDARAMLLSARNTKYNYAEHVISNALVDIEGNTIYRKDGTAFGSMSDVLKQIPASQEEEFNHYLLDLHAYDRYVARKGVFQSDTFDNVSARIAQAESMHPEYKKVSAELQEWFDAFYREYRVNTGFIDQKTYDQFRKMYPHYIPTFREVEADPSSNSALTRRGLRAINIETNYNQLITGASDAPVANPVASMAGLVQTLVSDAKMAQAMWAVDNQFSRQDGGSVAERLPDTFANDRRTDEQTNLPDGFVGDRPEGTRDIIGTLDANSDFAWARKITNEDGTESSVIQIPMPDGTIHNWKMNDDGIFHALIKNQLADNTKTDELLSGISKVTGTFSRLVTALNAVFTVQNFNSDGQTAMVTGNSHGFILGYYVKRLGTMFNLVQNKMYEATDGKIGRDDAAYARFQLEGSIGSPYFTRESKSQRELRKGLYGKDTTAAGKAKAMRQHWQEVGSVAALGEILSSPLRALGTGIEGLSELLEETTRYDQFRNSGLDLDTYEGRIKAGKIAREATTDFSKHGDWKGLKAYGVLVPFARATLQGQYKTMRMFSKENEGNRMKYVARLAGNAILHGAMGAILRELTWDDDEKEAYDQISEYEKTKYTHIKFPGIGILRIKNSQDGIIQAATAFGEFIADVTNGFEDNDVSQFIGSLRECLSSLSPSKDTIFDPWIDMLHNETYYGSSINGYKYDNSKIALQDMMEEDTLPIFSAMSHAAKLLGEDISPLQFQYGVQQFFGSNGMIAVDLFNGKSIMDTIDDNILSKFSLNPISASNASSALYANADILTGIIESYDMGLSGSSYLRSGLSDIEFKAAAREASVLSDGVVKTAKSRLKDLWKKYNAVNESDMEQAEKDEQLHMIRMNINRIALSTNEAIGEYRRRWCNLSIEEMIGNGFSDYIEMLEGTVLQ